ncbi:myrosinase 1-like [Schistocerca piceifrons]|uniref:myrosinase 1-like n=1 Tax=Schistocerca piceifrons TaxID=274613 RepID=UPI001F5EC7CB|nr:myrosinase 1-like [Schistocerca piceifrons]
MLVLLVAVVSAVVAEKSAVDLSRLPDGFLMGTATSAYQTEGAWNEDGKGESIWDNLVHRNPNYSVDCSNGDVAADSYHKYRRDVAMLKELGVDVYRFSVSWPRIMPTGDPTEINDKGVAHYDALINLLLENGITPMVTMYHWDLPQRLQDIGGWANPIMAYYFEEYANVLFTKFGDRVKWWVTINEPEHIAAGYEPALSVYVPSVAPGLPGHPGVGSYLAAHTMLLAHGRAYRLYNTTFRHRQHGRLGLALSAVHIQPASDAPEDVAAARRLFQFQVGWFAQPVYSAEGDYPPVMRERIDCRSRMEGRWRSRLPSFSEHERRMLTGSADFIGVNEYTSSLGRSNESAGDAGASMDLNPQWPTAAAKWLQVVPWGFREILNTLAKEYPGYPIFVTENGYADLGGLNDTDRIHYIVSYMSEMLKAIYVDKVPVIGYTYWSLMDSYEWDNGYRIKFGLYSVDFKHSDRKRRPKQSARVIAAIIKRKRLPQWLNMTAESIGKSLG